jgi:hypothetical protein
MGNDPNNSHNDDPNLDNDLEKITPNDLLKFADTFNHKKTQKLISETINGLILQAVRNDHNTRSELKKIRKELEKEDWKVFLKKFLPIIYTLLGAIFTGIVYRILNLK